jgi:threonylcarbamoyladenosine tRNA methylthiotransferase MtaB
MNPRVTGDTDVLAHCHTFIIARRNAAIQADAPGTRDFPPIERFPGHQRAFVKVQDGCDAFCTYCIVPYTRPRVWSRDVGAILAECRQLVDNGHREIVLSGVFLGAFGRATALRRRWKNTPSPLPRLLGAVAEIDGLWRVRLSSLEPGDLTDELLAVLGECPTVAPHLHLPLQSGSPAILERMRRQYTADEYRRTIDRTRSQLDHPAITTDILVGFPGETDDDFEATLDLARHAGFAKIHAFSFSAVEGTIAWRYRGEAPPPPVVKARMARLAETERVLADAYRRPLVGQVMEALVESPHAGEAGDRQAMTDRYQTIHFRSPAAIPPAQLTGQVVRLRVREVLETGLGGELLS